MNGASSRHPRRVFLSYAREDAAPARSLAEAIRAGGHRAVVDTDLLRGGDDFEPRLKEAILGCDACVVLWSSRSVGSRWVRAEANLALEADRLVIPVRLDDCELPLPFTVLQAVDLSQGTDAQRVLEALRPQRAPAPPPRAKRSWETTIAMAALALYAAGMSVVVLRPTPQPTEEVVDVALGDSFKALYHGSWCALGDRHQIQGCEYQTEPQCTGTGRTCVVRPQDLFCLKPASANPEDVRNAECFTRPDDCRANGFHCVDVLLRRDPIQVGIP